MTLKGERFLLYDSHAEEGSNEKQIIMFATKENFHLLMNSDTWFMDGTFRVAPSIFMRLVIKAGNYAGEEDVNLLVALVYTLLASNQKHTTPVLFRKS
ncbi:hypothetical protein ANN_21446 [Periplaneta americana]|uniref:Uncharacterized protein n=1 Tax=Periplaneta americana TaxID=6978 RepID=A0ABQ8SFA5_PERAM|nr:hypothetical protein ANN_21446 [Periplaneta americana]